MIGVCGAGMAPLAIYLSQRGYEVFGFDDNVDFHIKDMLTANKVIFLPKKETPPCCNYVVRSSAIDESTDPICQMAKELSLPIFRRGEFLAKVCEGRKVLAVVGSHGKTSVSGSCVEILRHNGVMFDYVIGGFFKKNALLPAQHTDGSDWIVVEVDESDGTMKEFCPECTIALNYDDDHICNYGGRDGLMAAFHDLFARTSSKIFVQEGEEIFSKMTESFPKKLKKITRLETEDFNKRNHEIAAFCTREIFNKNLAIPDEFVGIKRRNDVMLTTDKLVMINDYAHHPTELEALLKYARNFYADCDINIIFQPHRMSRTKQYFKELAAALDKFDRAVVVELYTAFEKKIDGVSSNLVFDAMISKSKQLFSLKSFQDDVKKFCQDLAKKEKKQLVLFVGAGNILKEAKIFVANLSTDMLVTKLISDGIKLSVDKDVTNLFSIRVKTKAKVLVEPKNEDELKLVLSACRQFNIMSTIIGNGTNVLPPDIINGAVIKLVGNHWGCMEFVDDKAVYCACGVQISDFCKFVSQRNFCGIEKICFIPGCVAGAICMNAGSYGQTISDCLISVRVMDDRGNVHVLKKDEIDFSYRHSSIPNGYIILGATFLFSKKMPDEYFKKICNDLINSRRAAQPFGPTFGSVFKNQKNSSSGELIDKCGLKGKKISGAEISEKHANFIINNGRASSSSVEQLIDTARYEVFNKFGKFLETEVKILR